MVETTIARPYAKAAFEFSKNHNKVDYWYHKLEKIVFIISHIKINFIFLEQLSSKQIISFFIDMCSDELDLYIINFLKILIYNKRLRFLNLIFKEFQHLNNDYNNVVDVRIFSTRKLTNSIVLIIESFLVKRIHKNINFIYEIDISIIEGIKIKIKDTIINCSVDSSFLQLLELLHLTGNKYVCT